MKRVCSCGYETTDRGNFSKHQKRCKQHEFSTQLQQLQQENAELKSRLAGTIVFDLFMIIFLQNQLGPKSNTKVCVQTK